MTRRRWIADTWDSDTASLRGSQAEHLIRVLRAQAGMQCDVIAGNKVWRAAIAGISGDAVLFRLISEAEAEAALPITLLISIFKFDRMEWIVEKATELGVQRLIPIVSRRSGKHLVHAAPARVERWRRIAREAAQQSRRSDAPVVADVTPLKSAARAPASSLETTPSIRLLLAEQETSRTLRAALEETALTVRSAEASGNSPVERPPLAMAVGPEGGWTAEEETLFQAEGWIPVSLGPRILRAETAAIAAIAAAAILLA